MPFVVTDACVKCKYTDCVAQCPVNCFHEGENFLAIHPTECIECDACVPVCPVGAIYEERKLPPHQRIFLEINAVFTGVKPPGEANTEGWPEHLVAAVRSPDFKVWPKIASQREPLPEAEEWKSKTGKLEHLSPAGAAG